MSLPAIDRNQFSSPVAYALKRSKALAVVTLEHCIAPVMTIQFFVHMVSVRLNRHARLHHNTDIVSDRD